MNVTNSKSIVSLTMGILSIFIPIVGLIVGTIGIILSIKSIKEINNSGENGKGFAISGRVCSIVGICIQLILIAFLILGFFTFSLYNNTEIK